MLLTVLAAVLSSTPPADAERALAELAAFGPVESCAAVESAISPEEWERDGDLGGTRARTTGRCSTPRGQEPSHVHVLELAQPLPSLSGKAPRIAPYLKHPSRQVVHRAIDLLCRVGDKEARDAILAAARSHPCHRWMGQALRGVGIEERLPYGREACDGLEELGFIPGTASDWSRWVTPKARALSARLERADPGAIADVRDGLDAIALARSREAAAALSLVRSREAWISIARGLAPYRFPDASFEYVQFVQGMGPFLLRKIAASNKISLARELTEVVSEAPDLFDHAYYIGRGDPATFEELIVMAAAAGGESGVPRQLDSWFERIDQEAAFQHGKEHHENARRLVALSKASDREGLRAFMKDGRSDLFLRVYAGSLLVQMGEVDGLDIFEEARTADSARAYTFRQVLEPLARTASGLVLERVQRVLRLYPVPANPEK